MVRDWLKLSETSFHNKKLVKLFHPTTIEQHLQKTYFLKYLLDYYNEKEAVQIFEDICCENDSDRILVHEEIIYLLKVAKKQVWPKRQDIYFFISQKEIDYINTIQAPREFRLFILGILIYGKYTKQQVGIPFVNARDRSYAYYLVTHKDDFNKGKQRSTYLNSLISNKSVNHKIVFYPASTNIKNTILKVPKTITSFDADWINWKAKDGYCIMDMDRDPYKLADLIQDWYGECPICQSKYIISKKAKTDLCPTCYELYRHEYKAGKERDRRAKIKMRGQE